MLFARLVASLALVLGVVTFSGCGSEPAAKPAAAPAKPAGDAAVGDAEAKALAGLSAEDRALAVKQAICLVSGEKLGSMGTPYKVQVKGKTVFLCCDGCKDDLLADPDRYLAKLAPAEKSAGGK